MVYFPEESIHFSVHSHLSFVLLPLPNSAYVPLNNYLVFNDVDGLYTYTFEAERKVGDLKFITEKIDINAKCL